MRGTVSLTIDGQPVTVESGATILQAARMVGKNIPTICYHAATTSNGLCRICVVEVEGQRLLQPACIVKVAPDMKVNTASDRVLRARRTILEMLASTMDLSESAEILAMLDEYAADAGRFPGASRRESGPIDDNPMYIRDYAKCLLCWRCVQVCAEDAQYTFAINFSGRGYETQIGTFFDQSIPESTCVLCGQCVGVCPTGALKPRREYLLEQGITAEEISVLSTGKRQRRERRAE